MSVVECVYWFPREELPSEAVTASTLPARLFCYIKAYTTEACFWVTHLLGTSLSESLVERVYTFRCESSPKK